MGKSMVSISMKNITAKLVNWGHLWEIKKRKSKKNEDVYNCGINFCSFFL